MQSAIILCALVSVAAAVGVLGLTMYVRSALSLQATRLENCYETLATLMTSSERLNERVLMLQSKCDATDTLARNTTAGALAGQVADLGADLAKLAQSMRKQFGSVWAELQQSGALGVARASQTDLATAPAVNGVDPEVAAMLALQSAPPAK